MPDSDVLTTLADAAKAARDLAYAAPATKVYTGNGAMFALFPSADEAQRFALSDDSMYKIEEADDLHVTLAYLGKADDLAPDQVDHLFDVARRVASMVRPFYIGFSGVCRYAGGEDGDPIVLTADCLQLDPLRHFLEAALGDTVRLNLNHAFNPHMTLAYIPASMPWTLSRPTPVGFYADTLYLCIAGVSTAFPLRDDFDAFNFDASGGMSDVYIYETLAPHDGPLTAALRGLVDRSLQSPDAPLDLDEIPQSDGEVLTTNEGVSQRAVWSTAFINDLPDTAFLYVEPGGEKEAGKTTPRSLRHFPYRDAEGNIDLPHLRNAIARIPQSNAEGLDDAKKKALQERARKLLGTADKAGSRMQGGMRERLANAMAALAELFKWASYEDDDDIKRITDPLKPMPGKPGKKAQRFIVVKAADGSRRWFSFSSNGFEDKTGELVTTRALEDVVEYGDETGDRGSLRIYHIPGTDIGRCDFQGVEGRVLIESGVFDDTPLARKAIEYFETTDDDLGTSIGFLYPVDEFDGRDYESIRVFERSVCPREDAANEWTSFVTLTQRGDPMHDKSKAFLTKLAGDDLANELLGAAAHMTKELEGSVRFKTDETSTPAETPPDPSPRDALAAAIAALPDGDAKTAMTKSLEETFPVDASTKSDEEVDVAAVVKTAVESVLASMTETIKGAFDRTAEALTAIDERVKALETPAVTKTEPEDDTPRGAAATAIRATASDKNVLDAEKIKDLIGEELEADDNPAIKYLEDLKTGRAGFAPIMTSEGVR